jgi:2,5-diamino-6-(ribosylamino)-4(3H)-pyrimidinone 5'-phosphate reductase
MAGSRAALQFSEDDRLPLQAYLPDGKVRDNQAFVTLTFATSLDSQLSLSPGMQTVLSGPKSKAMTHYLRSRHDAILIGVGTAVADDPGLNCRLEGVGGYGGSTLEGQPRPVIVDPHARWDFSERSKMFVQIRQHLGKAPFIITCVEEPPSKKKEIIESFGGKFIHIPTKSLSSNDQKMSWPDILAALKEEGICSVMIEGGGTVINSLLACRHHHLINSIIITIAPTWLGKGGVVVSPERRVENGNAVPAARLIQPRWSTFGDDVILCGRLNS